MDDSLVSPSENMMESSMRDSDENLIRESALTSHGKRKKPALLDNEKKAQSAWILFVNDYREKVKLDNPDLSCSEQSKVLSQIWQQLDRSTVDNYIKLARQGSTRYRSSNGSIENPSYNSKGGKGKDDDNSCNSDHGVSIRRPTSASLESVCPMGRMRRIIKLDPEVGNVTKEATALIEKAMQLFLEELAKRSWEMCTEDGRRNIKTQDIAMCIHSLDQYHWCKADFDKPAGL